MPWFLFDFDENDFAWLGWLVFVFDLVNYLVALEFVWLKSHHTSFLPMSCLCHLAHVIMLPLVHTLWFDDVTIPGFLYKLVS